MEIEINSLFQGSPTNVLNFGTNGKLFWFKNGTSDVLDHNQLFISRNCH